MKLKKKNAINLGPRRIELNNKNNIHFLLNKLLQAHLDRELKGWMKVWRKIMKKKNVKLELVMRFDIKDNEERVVKDEVDLNGVIEVKPEPRQNF